MLHFALFWSRERAKCLACVFVKDYATHKIFAPFLDILHIPFQISVDDISAFVPKNDFESYLEDMSKDGTWGDHIVLVALANALGRTIRVVTSLETDSYDIVIETDDKEGPPILLGHLSENHYLSLEPMETSKNNAQGIHT